MVRRWHIGLAAALSFAVTAAGEEPPSHLPPADRVTVVLPAHADLLDPRVRDHLRRETSESMSRIVPAPAASARPVPMGHAADYTSLTGTLHFLHVRQRWTLRYAGLDQEDRYGGSVTLLGGGMQKFHDGDAVRVSGYLLNPTANEPAPAYHLQSIQLLQP